MAKKMWLRRNGNCADCGTALPAKTEAVWFADERVVRCLACVAASAVASSPAVDTAPTRSPTPPPVSTAPSLAAPAPPAPSTPPAPAAAPSPPPPPVPPVEEPVDADDDDDEGVAGASAQREYERRSGRERARKEEAIAADAVWRARISEQKPVVGRLMRAVTPRPTIGPESQPTEAWKVGAQGERRVAEVLHGVAGIDVLHDRRVPGTRANIDHLAIGPRGVYVIDAKKYAEGSEVEVRDKGSFLRSDPRLFVGGRDRTKLVDGMLHQIEVVRVALGDEFADVPTFGVLCFVGSTWGRFRMTTKTVKGVTALWPKELPIHVACAGDHVARVGAIADHLRRALPPA